MVKLPRRRTGVLPIFVKPDTLSRRPCRISERSAVPPEAHVLCPPEAPMEPTPDFNPKTATKKLLREGRSGALATLMPGSGDPYCSLVNVATAADGAPLLLISRLAVHTKNILADPRVSLMIDERKEGDPLQGGRIMMVGTAAVTDDPNARRRYLDRQPEAEGFASFADFSFYQIALKSVHLVAGFGRIVDLKPADVLTPTEDAGELVAAEPEVLAHMNEDHAEACRLYATKLLGAPDGAWRCVGCDPEGLELQLDRLALRLPFPQRVRAPGVLRVMLKQLAEQARAA
jgi:putative heme iron utilization protein